MIKFNKKITIGIDIEEVIRAKWLQFDKYYVQEFGEEGVPLIEPYVFDFYNNYEFEDVVEIIQELKDAEDMPNDINPLFYQVDEKTGKAPVDSLIFKKPEENKLSGLDRYQRFMYEDFLLEIHGLAPLMYRGLDLHLKSFIGRYESKVDFVIMSVENKVSIPPTLYFLSKTLSRFANYRFVENAKDMWKGVDVLITTNPDILKSKKPFNKKLIKVKRPYNQSINKGDMEILQLNDLYKNKKFEKIIKYNK